MTRGHRRAARFHSRRRALAALGALALAPATEMAAAAADTAQPEIETLSVGGARIEVQFAPGFTAPWRLEALAWVHRCADAVTGYFGRFPVREVDLLLLPRGGAGVHGGVTFAEPSLLIRIGVGADTTGAQFSADWILVHEMIHLAIPQLADAHNWLHEGVATYVESVARGRAGLVTAESVWHEWVRAMPQGQPQAGDAGLDHTRTWGRTYWGGAIFCLMADVRLLAASGRQAGLQQALQGVLAAGGNYEVAWPVQRLLAAADHAVGQTTLAALYADMKDSPRPAPLDALWRDLGVTADGFDDTAPLAAVRRTILS